MGGVSEECLEVCFLGLVVRGNYVWCLVIFVIFMGFGGAEVRDVLKSSLGGGNASHKREDAGYYKRFYRIPPFPIFLLFHLRFVY